MSTIINEVGGLRAVTLLNECGDVTIVWTDDQDERMEAIIARKMEQGITFFIIEPRFFGLLPSKKTPLKNPAEARKHRALAIPDEDFAAFVADGKGDAVSTPDEPTRKSRLSRDAKEVATSQSVGVRQAKGG